jgi:hypothetical protein
MRIAGEWFTGDDGESRPLVRVLVAGLPGQVHVERFLIDTGADRTVLSAGLLIDLGLPVELPPPGSRLRGISGDTGLVIVNTMIEFTTDEGRPARVRGRFAAFTDRDATDVSILGRDVLDNFDVIVSRRRDEVLLLAPNHQYQVARG